MDFARLHVTMLDRQEVTSPMPVVVLPPVQEQVAPEEVDMTAEEVVTEEPEEGGGFLGDAQMLFGKDEKDLMASQ